MPSTEAFNLSFDVTVDASHSGERYEVQRSPDGVGSWEHVRYTNNKSVIDGERGIRSTWYYRVREWDSSLSAWSGWSNVLSGTTFYTYEVRYAPTGTESWTEYPEPVGVKTVRIDDLTPDATFDVQVRAGDGSNWSDWSTSMAGTTYPATATVSWTEPASGATLTGMVDLLVATDHPEIHDIRFRIGATVLGTTQPNTALTWDSTETGDGATVITAEALAEGGSVIGSADRSVTVDNGLPVPVGGSRTAQWDVAPPSMELVRHGYNSGALTGNPNTTLVNLFHSTVNPYEGSGHGRAADASNEWLTTDYAAQDEVYASFMMYVPTGSLPAGTRAILRISTGATNYRIQLINNGQMRITEVSTGVGEWSSTIPMDTWFRIGVHYRRDTVGNGLLEGILDDTVFMSQVITDTTQVSDVRIGSVDNTGPVTYDWDHLVVATAAWPDHTVAETPFVLGSPLSTEASPFTIWATAPITGGPNPSAAATVSYRTPAGSGDWIEWGPATINTGTDEVYASSVIYGETIPGIRGLAEDTEYEVRILLQQAGESDQELTAVRSTLPGFHSWTYPGEYPGAVTSWFWASPLGTTNTTFAEITKARYINNLKGHMDSLADYRTAYETRHGAGAFLPLMHHQLFNQVYTNGVSGEGREVAVQLNNTYVWDTDAKTDFDANVEPFEECFLHRYDAAEATKLTRIVAEGLQWYMNPGSPRWRRFQLRQEYRLEYWRMSTALADASRRVQASFHDNIFSRPSVTTENSGLSAASFEYPTRQGNQNGDYRMAVGEQVDILQEMHLFFGGNCPAADTGIVPSGWPDSGFPSMYWVGSKLDLPMYEIVFLDGTSAGEYKSVANWRGEVDNVYLLRENNPYVAVICTARLNQSGPEGSPNDLALRFAWFSWLMVVDDPQFGTITYRPADSRNYQLRYEAPDNLWQTDLGLPLADYDGPETTGVTDVYRREFANYIAVFNPSGSTRTYDGTSIPPRDGVLFVQEEPEPEPPPTGEPVYHVADQDIATGTGNTGWAVTPANISSGDMILLIAVADRGGPTPDPGFPAEFTAIPGVNTEFTNGTSIRLAYRIATSSEPLPYSGTWASMDSGWHVIGARITGFDTEAPIGNTSSVHFSGGSGTNTMAIPGVATTEENSMLLALVAHRTAEATDHPAGTDEAWDLPASVPGSAGSYEIVQAVGETGDRTFTWPTSTRSTGMLLIINPGALPPADVDWTDPLEGATVSGTVDLVVESADDRVTQVRYRINGVVVGTVDPEP